VPVRYLDALEEWIEGQFTATKRTLEAIRAELLALGDAEAALASDDQTAIAIEAAGLKELSAVWEAQRRPAVSTRREMRTAVARFAEVNGPLPYRAISVEHVKRFKAALHGDQSLRSATKQKRWAMVRTLMAVAKEDALIEDDPFDKVRLGKLADDAEAREDLTKADLRALFAMLDGDEWWLVRLGLYTGARLGELCQLTKADVVAEEGVLFLSISADAEAGRTVKTRNSVRKVPVHRQLLADGFEEWVGAKPGDRLFPWGSAVASKRLMRRFRDAGLGRGKVVHSLRHTFISAARTVMEEEWREKLTGHASQRVGRTYGSYGDLKAKVDLVRFGLETG
jgi:integrase